ncbi:MAG: PD-(D/E)XK nuclease family protein [Bacilli bacterium]|jgi:putative RecB family exonuclease
MNAVLKILRDDEHISVSSLNTYMLCPRQYQHRYVLGTPVEHRGAALAFGSATHETLASFYNALRAGNQEPTLEELSATFRDAWTKQLDDPTPVLLDEKDSVDSLTDMGIGMIGCFLENAPRPSKVIEVEMPFSIELVDRETGEVLPRLVGVFDAVVQDEDGAYRILEHKTAAKRWTQDKLAFDAQLTGYHVAAPLMGLPEAKVTVQLLLKTKKPGFEVYTPSRTEADKRDFVEMAIGVQRAIRAGAFYPKRDWACSGCSYSSRCLAG